MRNTRIGFSPLILPLLCAASAGISAPARAVTNITLRATRTAILADGKHSTDLIAEVRDGSGRALNTPVTVQFQTTSGTLSQSQAIAFAGRATVRLTSAPVANVAHVTAFTPDGNPATIDVVYTDDPEATFEGNNYMLVTGASYLAYSATDKVIEALGKNGTARLVFHNMDISADHLQYNCTDGSLRAFGNVTFRRGRTTLKGGQLFYDLQNGVGDGIFEHNGKVQTVSVSGENLVLAPLNRPLSSSHLLFPDLQVKLIITARSITYFPGERLQFRRPKFYQDSTQILSLPYYELPLNSQELFSDQFVSIGTNGFGLEVPFYYNLTPKTTGIVYLRHQQQVGRGYYSYDPGWAVDLVQGYSSQGERRYEGALGFTGLTRSNWGFRWSHNQEINSTTQGSMYLDFPQHNSVYTASNLSQQLKVFRWGANVAGGQTFSGGPSETTYRSDLFAETQPHPLAKSKLLSYTFGTTFSSGRVNSNNGLIGNTSDTSESLTARAFTRPLYIDSRTTLTNSFTLGQTWSTLPQQGFGALATIALDHTFKGGGAATLTYDLISQPGLLTDNGRHRLSLSYNYAAGKRFSALVFGSAFLDAADSSLLADLTYRLSTNWRLLASATLQQFAGQSYRDIQLIVGRRIGARELQLAYSTLKKRFSVDFTATRF